MSIGRQRRARRGLSFVEFVGCVFAITGGIAIGSMYFGFDVEEAAVRALQYTELMPPPADAPPQPSAPASELQQAPVATTAQAAAEPAAAPPADAPVAAAAPAAATESTALTPELRRQLSQGYWSALNACMQAEAEHRGVQPEGGLHVHEYLAQRREGHRAAAEAIAQLKLWGVDGHVAAYAERVQAWHESGAEMFARASNLVTDAPTAQLSGPFAQEWQSASTQHQMEERLLAEKHAAIQSYLDHASKEK